MRSWLYRLLIRFGGVADPDGKMPRDMMIASDPQRVILSHGRWYARNGAAELRRAFRWLL